MLRGIKEDYHSGLAYPLHLVRGSRVPLSRDQRPRQLEFYRVTELLCTGDPGGFLI